MASAARRLIWGSCLTLLFSPSILALEEPETDSASSPSPVETPSKTSSDPEATFLETVTVAATRSERTLEETPGKIDVIQNDEITKLGYTSVTDLVRFAPGVYVEGDLTRLGTSGFNVRGIGGNRVLTEIDGIPTTEQFDFGPFSVTQYSLDLDMLERVEIVRSAGSALYGSDALGGVVSLVTRSPRGYLGDAPQYLGLRAGHDSRADETSESVVYARGNETWQGSIVYTRRDGAELDNQGKLETEDFTRTAPNPIDRSQNNALLKLGRTGQTSQLQAAFEWFDGESETEVLSGRAPASPFASAVRDLDTVDTQSRTRLSVEQSLVQPSTVADSLLWRAYYQEADTDQVTDEIREGSLGLSRRNGLLTFDQETLGFEFEGRKGLGRSDRQVLTYGLTLQNETFDQLRDRTEVLLATGEPVPTQLVFPTKYFPESDVQEAGAFVQAEFDLWNSRLRLIPGVRYDRYALDANAQDRIYLDGNPGTPEPVDITDEAISPKLGMVLSLNEAWSLSAQYARGFRAPPMSAVNNGFTNQAGGYRTLANPDLDPETSDNLELGLRGRFARGSFSVTVFDNHYDDFIETVTLGFHPTDALIEFQPQNIQEVEISGIEAAAELRLTPSWRWRTAYSYIEGDSYTEDGVNDGEPLESIAPSRLVSGLRYASTGGRWGVEGTATLASSKRASDLPAESTQFRPPGYEVFDLAGWFALTPRISLQATAWNLTDATYWQWTYVRGRTAGAADLDRYTSPGRSFGLQARIHF